MSDNNTKKVHSTFLKIVVSVFLSAAIIALVVVIAIGNSAVGITEYEVVSNRLPKSFSGMRILQISDFHNTRFGKNNERLTSLMRSAAPDIIVMSGDILDSRRTRVDIALDFAAEAVKVAPVFFVSGNHEVRLTEEYSDFKTGLSLLGVTVLSDAEYRLYRGTEYISLIGIDDFSFHLEEEENERDVDKEQLVKNSLLPLVSGDSYKILLAHRPELIETYSECGVDLVFSGHAHGGQFRLPGIGGILAPGQGLFPRYDSGLFDVGGAKMIVSRGVGNSAFPFRFNNNPELCLVMLVAG